MKRQTKTFMIRGSHSPKFFRASAEYYQKHEAEMQEKMFAAFQAEQKAATA